MFEEGTVLHQEYGMAMGCHERALLYAGDASKINQIRQRAEPPASPTVSNPAVLDLVRCLHITFLYTEAIELLAYRLNSVMQLASDYSAAIVTLGKIKIRGANNKIEKTNIKIGDRDEQSTSLSKAVVLNRSNQIEANLRQRTKRLQDELKKPGSVLSADIIKLYQRDWVGFHNICRLLMEEITYLRSRVDEFINVSISHASLRNR